MHGLTGGPRALTVTMVRQYYEGNHTQLAQHVVNYRELAYVNLSIVDPREFMPIYPFPNGVTATEGVIDSYYVRVCIKIMDWVPAHFEGRVHSWQRSMVRSRNEIRDPHPKRRTDWGSAKVLRSL